MTDLRNLRVIAAVLMFAVAVVSFWMGRQTITPPTLSDLSQQRARDISIAVFQDCLVNFKKDAKTETAWHKMANRCGNVADVALEEMYKVGVEAEDRVLEAAKKLAREAKP